MLVGQIGQGPQVLQEQEAPAPPPTPTASEPAPAPAPAPAPTANPANKWLLRAMQQLSTGYNPEATSLADRLRQSISDTQSGRESEQNEQSTGPPTEVNPDTANVLAILTMIDCLDGDFGKKKLNIY